MVSATRIYKTYAKHTTLFSFNLSVVSLISREALLTFQFSVFTFQFSKMYTVSPFRCIRNLSRAYFSINSGSCFMRSIKMLSHSILCSKRAILRSTSRRCDLVRSILPKVLMVTKMVQMVIITVSVTQKILIYLCCLLLFSPCLPIMVYA